MQRVKFKDMPYARPDLESTKDVIAKMTERLEGATTYEEAREVFLPPFD